MHYAAPEYAGMTSDVDFSTIFTSNAMKLDKSSLYIIIVTVSNISKM